MRTYTLQKTGCFALVLCLLLTGAAAGERAASVTDQNGNWFRLLAQRVAAQQYDEILIHPEADAPVQAALEAVLAEGATICQTGQKEIYDFPMLEWESDVLVYRVCGIYGEGGVESWVITFFPSGLSTMAASVAMTPGGQMLGLFSGSTWAMHTLWEEALGDLSHFWQPQTVFRFSQLFEGDNLWNRAHQPGQRDIPQAAAMRIAAEMLEEKYSISEEERSLWRVAAAFHLSSHQPGQLVWAIHYYQQQGADYTLLYTVVMDSKTGQVLEATRNEPGGLG